MRAVRLTSSSPSLLALELREVELGELRPDVVVCDLGFGGRTDDSIELVLSLRERTTKSDMALIVLTGLAIEEVPTAVRDAADVFLRKPVAPDRLLSTVTLYMLRVGYRLRD